MSKHRRVKSLVREFDSQEVQLSPSSSLSQLSPHSTPPTLQTRASSSSISSLASLSPSTPDQPGAGLLGLPSSTRRVSNSSIGSTGSTSSSDGTASGHQHHNHYNHHSGHSAAKQLDYGSQDSGHSKMSSNNSASSGHAATSASAIPIDSPTLESEEQDDVFLPLSSPFTPGYTVGSTSSSSSPRRDSTFSNGSSGPPSASMTAAERREHSRRHSRVHSRNLSVFFPRPEQKGLPGYQDAAQDDTSQEQSTSVSVEVPGAQTRGWGFGNGSGAMGSGNKPYGQSQQQVENDAATQANSRRGHHHRHSMSHNFFPFLDTNAQNQSPRRVSASNDPNKASPTSPLTPLSAAPKSVPSVSPAGSRHRHTRSDPSLIPSISNLRTKYSHLPGPVRLLLAFAFHLPVLTQLALLASFGEIALGASLWIAGQSGESLAVTGLGYLVVFDGIGALSSILVEGNARGVRNLWDVMSPRRASDNAIRNAFGTARSTTLSHFAQCVYLIFSAVYVCKESIEHVLLLHGPDEEGIDGHSGDASHGAAHGSFGHGESIGAGSSTGGNVFEWEDMGVLIPTKLLVLSMSACFFAAVALQNHATLTEAVGSHTYSLRPRLPAAGGKHSRLSTLLHNAILSNPFSLIVLIFSFGLAAASIFIPAIQLAPLDKVVALLESIAMFYIAYPAAVATGKVLLQTAPSTIIDNDSSTSLRRAIEEIENHQNVVYLPPPHIWQLTPHPPPVPTETAKSSSFGREGSVYSTPSTNSGLTASGTLREPPITIVTLNVQVRKESTDTEILEMTRWCREKCMLALVGTTSGQGRFAKAELTVQVVRFEEERALQAEGHGHSHGHGHAHDSCSGHGHGHDHNHGHGHDNHGHGHSHDHDHGHSHSHDQGGHNHGHHH